MAPTDRLCGQSFTTSSSANKLTHFSVKVWPLAPCMWECWVSLEDEDALDCLTAWLEVEKVERPRGQDQMVWIFVFFYPQVPAITIPKIFNQKVDKVSRDDLRWAILIESRLLSQPNQIWPALSPNLYLLSMIEPSARITLCNHKETWENLYRNKTGARRSEENSVELNKNINQCQRDARVKTSFFKVTVNNHF